MGTLETFSLSGALNSGLMTRYDYDPWGRRVNANGGSFEANFGFTGHYYHAPSGLHLTLYRAYSPELGRWLNRDPIGEAGGANMYGYVRNDPNSWIDLLGLVPACPKTECEMRKSFGGPCAGGGPGGGGGRGACSESIWKRQRWPVLKKTRSSNTAR